jgi:hypothetical protein
MGEENLVPTTIPADKYKEIYTKYKLLLKEIYTKYEFCAYALDGRTCSRE